ncbi:polyketide beta-ketoacyl:acyl carrier protein synthase [Burkholderia pseudomallei]|uniref:Beta-ketoacyl synthase n=2 Tax=Burkholderia pseudomallei TaxID=28450 RepID=Q63LL7_BURPS|nr:beta-ketoacyl synthase N-terminal-like domain-containing protein [Burkholderia pseudomallei]AJX25007.1 polyketide biosynthesis malonyl-ACP decarboxylase PksF [Burkholderia pseudomallei K96243]AYX38250.1 polyketide beta-ketoacyl:ACP synthase [Burkholderia pseudomallei]MDE3324830.1 polyketide beta-ketoacyl:ACP synthase [Burkholderia pseudomallei]OMS11683.1 polyketide beta-ketoacyl:ACP synthase [Burkholderia pseudomallei]OMS28260.1 polyketide beta-ketoacyl:ACP synthase [Burkholderia pseudomall
MRSSERDEILITGVGVVSAIGQGRQPFIDALLDGRHAFGVMRRPGRQLPDDAGAGPAPAFFGAEIDSIALPPMLDAHRRTASYSAQAAVACVREAWDDAALGDVDPLRIGLVVGGSNVQQREQALVHDTYRGRYAFLRPSYGLSFMDSDLCGLCTELFGIRGVAFTVGGASASGQLAVLQACRLVESGSVDACIAVGALMDLSYWECQALRSLGAMGSDRFADEPDAACRPFDQDRDGFIYGECSGAIVVERAARMRRAHVSPYAKWLGGCIRMDGTREPAPSLDGEMAVIEGALRDAGIGADSIDYVNPHGSGSTLGDATELDALGRSGLAHARINTTKSLVGHGLSAAGIVELIATLLQMRARRLHPSRNLDRPIDERFDWVRSTCGSDIRRALKLSIGFGGINTALCLERC